MAYSAPVIHAVGDIFTASDNNILANDISFLAGTTGATVATSQTTASTSYVDLATAGPAVTVTTGANAIVTVTAELSNATVNDQSFMGYAISGATTLAAADATALMLVASAVFQASATYLQTGLTPGSNTFTAKYRVTASTGTWLNRTIIVQPLP